MTKIIILNGPPRCGKDTAANAIESYYGADTCKHMKISQPLKDISQMVFGQPYQVLEMNKEKELPKFNISYRDAQIGTFQQLIPVFGAEWLGYCMVNAINAAEQPYFVLSDGGRMEDIRPLIPFFGPENLMIVQIMREGCNFLGDIRSYIAAYDVRTRPIINDDMETFTKTMIDFAGEFFAE